MKISPVDELAKGPTRSTWRQPLKKFAGGLAGLALVCGEATIARAAWTPPESSVTPPAVVTLDAFAAPDVNGSQPSAALVVGPDGALYGSTQFGGTSGNGTLLRVETNGSFTKLHDFTLTDGAYPSAALVMGPDGALYGSTPNTGVDDFGDPLGYGTLFRMETNGTFTKLHDFTLTDGAYPSAALVVGPDGALYGSTQFGGTSGNGTLFRLETNGSFTKLHDFNGDDGAYPSAALVVGPDGALYGSTPDGRTDFGVRYGTLFRLETNGSFTKLHDFNGDDGYSASAALVAGPDGALYGSSQYGGTNGGYGYGTLFRLETNGNFTKLHDFNGADGAFNVPDSEYPAAAPALAPGPDGALYGSTPYGGTNGGYGYGTLFRVETNGSFTKLHDFNGTDGEQQPAALVVGPDGALYGSAQSGGTYRHGTLFRLETNGTFTKLYDFNGTDGAGPSAVLVVGPDGALYGSTLGGGSIGYGTLFRLETDGTFIKLHDFKDADAYYPSALVVGPDGALYGSAGGGSHGYGTLFRVQANGAFTKLHDFNLTDGAYPSAVLVVGPDGALYGSTEGGGTNGYDYGYDYGYGYGTLFRLETDGAFTKLHDFDRPDGISPSAALVMGPDGALYGSTLGGGSIGYGTLFRLETDGTFIKLHDFNGADGYYPSALVVGPDGALYGSTPYGGSNGGHGYGTLFRVETNGTFTKLHDFNLTDGALPSGALEWGPDGALYGSTEGGGTNGYDYGYGYGTLFRFETDGAFTKLHDFDRPDGISPSAALVVGSDGALYGSTYSGGAYYQGTLFRVETNGTFTKLHDFNGANGTNPSTVLVAGPDGALYGSTAHGGPRRGGILLKLVLSRPPVARCHDVTVSAGPNCAAEASVDDGSFDPDAGDTITLSQEPPGPYPLGATQVTLTVTDNHGASARCTATVTVVDTAPPAISDVAVTPSVLRPPNHKMVEVTLSYTATDNCGAVSNALSVASDEARHGSGDGTAPDWVVEDNHHLLLRRDRSGRGAGRVYAITVTSTDNAGNSSSETVSVTVANNQK